ncbi:unnamed protein product, partial [marine sediment metagenome]
FAFNPFTGEPDKVIKKSYLDALLDSRLGAYPQRPVLDRYDPTSSTPAAPADGDRYLSTATANGWTDKHIYEWLTSAWVETVPVIGMTTLVQDEELTYGFDLSSTWSLSGNASFECLGGSTKWGGINEFGDYLYWTVESVTTAGGFVRVPMLRATGAAAAPFSGAIANTLYMLADVGFNPTLIFSNTTASLSTFLRMEELTGEFQFISNQKKNTMWQYKFLGASNLMDKSSQLGDENIENLILRSFRLDDDVWTKDNFTVSASSEYNTLTRNSDADSSLVQADIPETTGKMLTFSFVVRPDTNSARQLTVTISDDVQTLVTKEFNLLLFNDTLIRVETPDTRIPADNVTITLENTNSGASCVYQIKDMTLRETMPYAILNLGDSIGAKAQASGTA